MSISVDRFFIYIFKFLYYNLYMKKEGLYER